MVNVIKGEQKEQKCRLAGIIAAICLLKWVEISGREGNKLNSLKD